MNVGELKSMLAKYPDDMVISAHIGVDSHSFEKEKQAVLYDILDNDWSLQYTALFIGDKHGSPAISTRYHIEHMTPEKLATDRREALRYMNDLKYRFTSDYGDYRFKYLADDQPSMLDRKFDRRVFDSLEAEGLVQVIPGEPGYERKLCCQGMGYELTEAGLAALTYSAKFK